MAKYSSASLKNTYSILRFFTILRKWTFNVGLNISLCLRSRTATGWVQITNRSVIYIRHITWFMWHKIKTLRKFACGKELLIVRTPVSESAAFAFVTYPPHLSPAFQLFVLHPLTLFSQQHLCQKKKSGEKARVDGILIEHKIKFVTLACYS